MTFRRTPRLRIARFLPSLLFIASLTANARISGQTPETPKCSTPNSSKPSSKPCSPPKSISEQFPFPGESPENKPPDSLEAPKPASDSKSAKDNFPYPGESPESSPGPTRSGSSGESSSSSDTPDTPPDVDGKPDLKDQGSEGSTRSSRRRLRPPAQKILSDNERVEEDLSVAHFYQQSGNLNGAYLRAKDAIKLQPQTPEAHLALADIAQKMGKHDEAVAEYTRYLELDPDGDGAKAARKNLEKLKP